MAIIKRPSRIHLGRRGARVPSCWLCTQSISSSTALKGLIPASKEPIVPTGTIINPFRAAKLATNGSHWLKPKPLVKCHRSFPAGYTSESEAHTRRALDFGPISPSAVLKGLKIKMHIKGNNWNFIALTIRWLPQYWRQSITRLPVFPV